MSNAGGRAYLDWNATAPLRPEARAAMIAAMDVVGNPSSVHAEGRAARGVIERARGQIATALGAQGADLIACTADLTVEAAAPAAAPHPPETSGLSDQVSQKVMSENLCVLP
jgi:cysteine desulfurase